MDYIKAKCEKFLETYEKGKYKNTFISFKIENNEVIIYCLNNSINSKYRPEIKNIYFKI
jgi:hypothetical protein